MKSNMICLINGKDFKAGSVASIDDDDMTITFDLKSFERMMLTIAQETGYSYKMEYTR